MRAYLLAFVHVAAALWIGCGDVLSPKRAEAPAPPLKVNGDSMRGFAKTPVDPDTLSIEALSALDQTIEDLMMTLSGDSTNIAAMRKLGWLYAAHGWYDRAIGPLARAHELSPADGEILSELDHVISQLGWEDSERDFLLPEAALEFAELAAVWGHGC